MTLTLGQWPAIGAITAIHCPNKGLFSAVENELEIARQTHIAEAIPSVEPDRIESVK